MTSGHIIALMLEAEKKANTHSVPQIGHCTDSASNAQIKCSRLDGFSFA